MGSPKTATTTQSTQIPQEVLNRYSAVNTRAEQTANTPFQAYSREPSDFVAPINSTQATAMQGMGWTPQIAQPYFDAANYYVGMGTTSANPADLDINKYLSPYTSQVADTTMANLRQQQEQQMSGQLGNAIRQGGFGGDRAGIAAANLAKQQQMGAAQTYADIMQKGYTQALGAAQQQQGVDLAARQANADRFARAGQSMMGLGQGIGGMNLQAQQALLGAGTLGQQTEQAGKTALYNQFLQERGYPFQIAQFLANIAMGTGALSGQTTQTQQPVPFFSDRRLKENVKRIGETDEGLGIFRYNYKGSPQTQIGLMAQDVERKRPEAVGIAAGYKTVDYDVATRPERTGKAGGGGIADIVAAQAAAFGPFSAAGLYGNKQSYVPAGVLPVQRLQIQAPPIQPIRTGVSELVGLANQGMGLGELAKSGYEMGSRALFGAEARGKDKASRGILGEGGEYDPDRGYVSALRRGRAPGGGVMPYANDEKPDYFPEEILTKTTAPESIKPQQAPNAPKSGFSDIMDAAKLAMKLASFGFARGGVVPADMDPEELAIRTIAAEAGGKSPDEARGIAAVINNRLASGKYGDNYRDVVLARNQFEPWSNPEGRNFPLRIPADSPRMALAREAFQAVRGGADDPTGGALHFYAPVAQASLGREPPKWAEGRDSTDIGPTRFVRGVDGGVAPRATGIAPRASGEPGILDRAASVAQGILPQKEDGGTDWKKIVIPTLTGLGAMASSPSLYAGSAMLQGLGAGAQSYANLERLQADIAQTKAGTKQTEAQTKEVIAGTARANVREVNGRMVVFAPDGKGGWKALRSFEYFNLPLDKRPSLSASDEEKLREDAKKGSDEGASSPAAPASPVAFPEAPKAPGAPEPAKAASTPSTTEAPKLEDLRPPSPVADSLTPAEKAKIQTVANEVESRGGGKDEPDFFTPQGNVARELQNMQPQMKALAVALASTPRGQSLLTSGPQSAILAPIAQMMNGLYKTIAGDQAGNLIENSTDLAKTETITKSIAQLRSKAAAEQNQSAVAALDRMAEQFPTLLNSKEGQGKLLAEILAVQRREIDKNEYFRAYLDHARKVNPDVAVKTGREADALFNDKYKLPFYEREQKALEKMFNGKVKIDGKDVPDPKTGRPMTWMQYLYENGSSLAPAERAWIEKEFKSPGILRYFGVQ